MTAAQAAIAGLAAWIAASSAERKAPLGNDVVVVGPFATLIPQSLGLAPSPILDSEALLLWIPEQQAPPGLPPIDTAAPTGHQRKAYRRAELDWRASDNLLFGVRLVPLSDPGETLAAALDREAPGLNLDVTAVVFVPHW